MQDYPEMVYYCIIDSTIVLSFDINVFLLCHILMPTSNNMDRNKYIVTALPTNYFDGKFIMNYNDTYSDKISKSQYQLYNGSHQVK